VALHFVSQLAREQVKVVLTGEGADELLGGYLKYRVTLWNLRYGAAYRQFAPAAVQSLVLRVLQGNSLPDAVRRRLRHTFLYFPGEFEKIYFDNFYSVFPQQEQSCLLAPELADEVRDANPYANSLGFFKPNGNPETLLNRLLYLDIKTYLVELLMKQDQMSMAASIESRVPFLDHKLVEFAVRIPARHKMRLHAAKYLLRRAMAGHLPPEILNRTKMGFPTPVKTWIRERLFEPVAAILEDGRVAERGLLNPTYVRDLLEAHRKSRIDATDAIWRLLNFELWNRIFFDGESAGTTPKRPAVPAMAVSGKGGTG
jgi:asparagine synthase (glutamine-hydrolysing)